MGETCVEMIRSDVADGESNERGFVVAMICGFEPMVPVFPCGFQLSRVL